MKNSFVIAVAAIILAAAGQAMGEDVSVIVPSAFNYNGEGIQDASTAPLAVHDAIGLVVLKPGVTDSSIQTLFAAGNVQGILNNVTVLGTTYIGCGDSVIAGGTPSAYEYSIPGVFAGVGPPSGDGSYGRLYLRGATADTYAGAQLYIMATNATSLTASAITQMGMWTVKGPTGMNGDATANQWVIPPNPSGITQPMILPDVGDLSPTQIATLDGSGDTVDPTDTLDSVIGPGEVPASAGWDAVFNDIWPGAGYTNDGAYAVQLAQVPTPTPEPSTLLLLATGLLGLLAYAWRKWK